MDFLQDISFINNLNWDKSPIAKEAILKFASNIIFSIIIAIVGYILLKFISRMTRKIIKPLKKEKEGIIISEGRAITLQNTIDNILKFIIYYFIIYSILDRFSISAAKNIFNAIGAAAGVAFGLGAQGLIKDIIAGFFIIFENQFSIGDVVEISDNIGKVESIGLRSTKIRTMAGEVHIIPNGKIDIVTNWDLDDYDTFINFYLGNEEDFVGAIDTLQNYFNNLDISKIEGLIDKPEVLGVSEFRDYDAKITIKVSSKTEERYSVSRAVRLEIIKCMKANDINLPEEAFRTLKLEDGGRK